MQEEDNIGSIIGKCNGIYILGCGRKIVLRILIVSVMGLRFSMQEEDVIEDTHDQCHVFTSQYPKKRDNIEHINGKCHVFIHVINLCKPRIDLVILLNMVM